MLARRLGVNGPRPFGSNRKLSKSTAQGQGARIRTATRGSEPTKQQPLQRVFHRVLLWFQKERRYDQEVRPGHIKTRLQIELQHEVACETVLHQQGSDKYNQAVLVAAQKRLRDFEGRPEAIQEWLKDTVFSAIGALARKPGMSITEPRAFQAPKCELSWATVDRMLWTLCQRDPELLSDYAQDPAWIVQNVPRLLIVWFDHSPLWIKFRGEEKVLVTQEEIQKQQVRRQLSKKVRQSPGLSHEHSALRESLIQHAEELASQTMAMAGKMCQGGDKYRITIIDFPAISKWLSQEEPDSFYLKPVLIVPCTRHVRLDDIDAEGCFNKEAPAEAKLLAVNRSH